MRKLFSELRKKHGSTEMQQKKVDKNKTMF